MGCAVQFAVGYIIMQAGTYVAQSLQPVDTLKEYSSFEQLGLWWHRDARGVSADDAMQNLVALPQYETFAFD